MIHIEFIKTVQCFLLINVKVWFRGKLVIGEESFSFVTAKEIFVSSSHCSSSVFVPVQINAVMQQSLWQCSVC